MYNVGRKSSHVRNVALLERQIQENALQHQSNMEQQIQKNEKLELQNTKINQTFQTLTFKNEELTNQINTVEFRILFGMFSAKVLVFVLTSIYVCMRQGWQPKGSMQSTSVLSTMGIFCIFATKSNDIALGVPLINATSRSTRSNLFHYLSWLPVHGTRRNILR